MSARLFSLLALVSNRCADLNSEHTNDLGGTPPNLI